MAVERAHAAKVRAAESESRHRLHERQAVERPHRPEMSTERDQRTSARKARARLETAETRVAELERSIDELTTILDDPSLYTPTGGGVRAAALGMQLEETKAALDTAFAEWERAGAEVDIDDK